MQILASYSKHRRQDELPIPSGLAQRLQPWLATRPAGQPVWPGTWWDDVAMMLRREFRAAGIPYKTDAGFLDFQFPRHHAFAGYPP